MTSGDMKCGVPIRPTIEEVIMETCFVQLSLVKQSKKKL